MKPLSHVNPLPLISESLLLISLCLRNMRRERKLLVCLLICISSKLQFLQAARISELAEADLECKDGVCKLGTIPVETNRKPQESLSNDGSGNNVNINVNKHTLREVTISKTTKKFLRLILKPFFTIRRFISYSLARVFKVSGGCIRSIGYITLRVSEACDSAVTSIFHFAPPILTVIVITIILYFLSLLPNNIFLHFYNIHIL